MDYNTNKKKRKAQSIQEMVRNDESKKTPIWSNYQGPYNKVDKFGNTASPRAAYGKGQDNDYSSYKMGGIMGYAGYIYSAVLALCLLVAVVYYFTGSKTSNRNDYSYPSYVFAINGVLTDIYSGKYDNSSNGEDSFDLGEVNNASNGYSGAIDNAYTNSSSVVGISGGATMPLDDGTFALSFPEAGSHEELLSQLESALASSDIKYTGSKIGYVDGDVISGYPESVVETFVSYMAGNTDKRNSFLSSIKDADKYSRKNGEALIVALPIISFKVTTDYEDTTFTFSGFGEQTINPGQQATIRPLLPCMYQISAFCPTWDDPIEGPIEATYGENLEVNFGNKN